MKDYLYTYPPMSRKAKIGWYVLVIILIIFGAAMWHPWPAENKGLLYIPEVHPQTLTKINQKELHIEQVKAEIRRQADEYGVDEGTALAIAECESSFNRYAINSVSGAKGVYQFLDKTWIKETRAPGSPFDYKENVKQFMIFYPLHPQWWECHSKIDIPA